MIFIQAKISSHLRTSFALFSLAKFACASPTSGNGIEYQVESHDAAPATSAYNESMQPGNNSDPNSDEAMFRQQALALAKSVQTFKFLAHLADERLTRMMENAPRARAEAVTDHKNKLAIYFFFAYLIIYGSLVISAIVMLRKYARSEEITESEGRNRFQLLLWISIVLATSIATGILVMTITLLGDQTVEVEEMMEGNKGLSFHTEIQKLLGVTPDAYDIQRYQHTLDHLLKISVDHIEQQRNP